MLNLKAVLERKASDYPTSDCVIEKIVELSETEYKYFKTAPLRDTSFISENTDRMYRDPNGIYHCLLVLGEGCSDGVLIEAEGYNYARYSSFIPGAREFVTARLNELVDQIIKESTQNTSNGTWSIYFDEIQKRYHVPVSESNGIGSMLKNILETRPELVEIGPMEDGFDMVFYLDYCPSLDEKEKLSPGMQMNFVRRKSKISTTELKVPFPSERLDALRFFMDRKQQTVEKELQDYLDKTYERLVPQNVREYVESRIVPEQDQEQTAESQQACAPGENQTPAPRDRQPRQSRRQREQAAPETPPAPEAQTEAEGPAEEENQGMTMSM